MKKITFITLALLAAMQVLAADDLSKLKETADRVWSMDVPEFDAKAAIPDSLTSGKYPAVIIARHVDLEATIEKHVTPHGFEGFSNINHARGLNRFMVKILDKRAVDSYSDFEFGDKASKEDDLRLMTAENTFGARIFKPDGTVRDVDLTESLKIAHGKDGDKEAGRRISIPGLEVGDVLDYFYIHNIDFEERNLPMNDITLPRRYPTMNFVFTGRFDPRLTVEYKARNGAPMPAEGFVGEHREERLNTLTLRATGIPATEDVPYLNVTRTYPELNISILNNLSRNVYILPTARPVGLHADVPFGSICRDIASLIGNYTPNEQSTGKARKMVADYAKAHPGLTPRQTTDLAWVALCYQIALDKNLKADDMVTGALFTDLIRKLKTYPESEVGIAFFNSRNDKPFNEVSRWSELDYGTIAGDSVYTLNTILAFQPGEWPGSYQGEQGAAFKGHRLTIDEKPVIPSVFTLPAPRASLNELNHQATATINPLDGTVSLDRHVQATGAQKSYYIGFTDMNEWLAQVEELFGVPADKRYHDSSYNTAERKAELDKMMLNEGETIIGTRPSSIEDYTITSRGVMPGSGAFEMTSRCSVDGLISDAGEDKLLAVGRLFYDTQRFKGERRERKEAHVWRDSPDSYRYKLTVNIPEGYTVTADALEGLTNNIQTPVGQFYTKASLDGDGRTVTIDMLRRINYAIIPATHWPHMLSIYDAAAAFNEAVLPLKHI